MNLDNGMARIRRNRRGVVHLVRPPLGEGLACDPKVDVERLDAVPDDAAVTCSVCLSAAA